jgi:hypothetical protein
MRKLLTAGLLALPLGAIGCASTGGICDCAAIPGDSTGYNPHVTYHSTCPGCNAAPVLASSSPVSTTPGGSESFEPIAPPKKISEKIKH